MRRMRREVASDRDELHAHQREVWLALDSQHRRFGVEVCRVALSHVLGCVPREEVAPSPSLYADSASALASRCAAGFEPIGSVTTNTVPTPSSDVTATSPCNRSSTPRTIE